MSYIWLGIGGTILFVSLLLVLPLVVQFMKKKGATSTTATPSTAPTPSIWTSGKAVKLGLLLGVVLFVEFYPWLEKWGKVTPVAFITGKLAGMEEANREAILTLLHLLPWVIAGLIAWNILMAATATGTTATGAKAKPSNIASRAYNALLVTIVGIVLIGLVGIFFGGTPRDVPSGETVEFNLVKRESVRQAVGINTPIRLIIPRPPVSKRGEIRTTGCAKIVAPEVATTIKGNPIELLSSDFALVFDMRLSPAVREFLMKNPLAGGVVIEFTRRQFDIEREQECP